jgi:4a-hydroxytetrahydrobiopterin dehydratase
MSANTDIINNLANQQCKPYTEATPALSQKQIFILLQQLDGWEQHGTVIEKTVKFSNFHQAMSFVNAVAWISNQEDHHPELTISYNKCKVEYTTHAVNGLTENDFICAAKVDALLKV